MTDAQRRILEDFADKNLVQLYRQDGKTRSTRAEWETECENILREGWLESGFAIAGDGHRLTDKGRAALKLEQLKPTPLPQEEATP
jgi:hypothetical protein